MCFYEGFLFFVMSEYIWLMGLWIFFYLIVMFWCFLGIFIVVDVFMCGIEKIISKIKFIWIFNVEKKEDKFVEVKVWNDIVVNLSLMVFGISVFEILMLVIEIVGNKFKVGELGFGIIVGFVVFNFFVIIGICIVCVFDGENCVIKSIFVYVMCMCFSMCVYIWMLIVLKLVMLGVVDIWESVVMFCMFFVLVVIVFGIDKGCWCKKNNKILLEFEIGIGKMYILSR